MISPPPLKGLRPFTWVECIQGKMNTQINRGLLETGSVLTPKNPNHHSFPTRARTCRDQKINGVLAKVQLTQSPLALWAHPESFPWFSSVKLGLMYWKLGLLTTTTLMAYGLRTHSEKAKGKPLNCPISGQDSKSKTTLIRNDHKAQTTKENNR